MCSIGDPEGAYGRQRLPGGLGVLGAREDRQAEGVRAVEPPHVEDLVVRLLAVAVNRIRPPWSGAQVGWLSDSALPVKFVWPAPLAPMT